MESDGSGTKQGLDRRRVTVAEAADILGITAEAVRTRIKRGKMDAIKVPPDRTGTVYVLLQADQTGLNIDPTSQGQDQTRDQTALLVDSLREQVAYLQVVIATRDQELAVRSEEIRRRDTALEREQQLAAFFAEHVQALEAPDGSSKPRESSTSPGPGQPAPSTPTGGEAQEATRRPQGQETTESKEPRSWWRKVFGW